MTSRLPVLMLLGPLLASSACQKPEPPHITPKEARVAAIGPQGLDLVIKVEATNPNRVTLSAQSFTAKARLDGRWDMGSVTVAKPIVLPPHTPTMIDVTMAVPWTDVKALTALAGARGPVPYVVDGSARIGGERINVDVPFSMSGTISREQVTNAVLKSIPTVPGLGRLPQ